MPKNLADLFDIQMSRNDST